MKKIILVPILLLCVLGVVSAQQQAEWENAMDAARTAVPLRMVYDEEGAQASKHIVMDISSASGQPTYLVLESTDDDFKPSKQDTRPLLKTGDSGVFNFYQYISPADFYAESAAAVINYLRDEDSSTAVYDITYHVTDAEGLEYTLEGELKVNKASGLPVSLSASYSGLPKGTKAKTLSVSFSGNSADSFRVENIRTVTDGVFLVFKFTMKESRTFTY